MDKNTVFRPAKRGLLSHIRRLLNGFKGLGILLLVILWSASLGSAQAGKGGEGKGKNALEGVWQLESGTYTNFRPEVNIFKLATMLLLRW